MKQRNSHKVAQREKVAFLSSRGTSLTSKHTCQIIEGFDNHIKAVEKDIDALIKNDEQLKGLMKLLCSVPGVGKITARAFIIITTSSKMVFQLSKWLAIVG